MPSNYFNRELSWIEFNARVLSQAKNSNIPLFERLKYISIVSSNFDEFFMVRVAGLKTQSLEELDWTDCTGLTAKDQLALISKRVHELSSEQNALFFKNILDELKKEGIEYIPAKKYSSSQKKYTENYYKDQIFPLLTPLRFGKSEEILPIATLKTHVAFLLEPVSEQNTLYDIQPLNDSELPLVLVQIPSLLDRIVWLPESDQKVQFTLIEDIITMYGESLFSGFSVKESLVFRVICDAATVVNEDNEDFIEAMENVLIERKKFRPIRVTCTSTESTIAKVLFKRIGVDASEIYSTENPFVDLTILQQFEKLEGYPSLRYPVWKNFYNSSLAPKEPLWDVLKKRDIFLHVPYQSFDTVLKFVEDAASDVNVYAIKMTLYRTSRNSPLIKSLIKAVRNGKQVTVVVELMARFDEERNIGWATKLQKAGATVIYGIVGLKVHAKMLLVVRKEDTGLVRYVHMGTGNYNEKTAKLYADMSIFTTNLEIADDANAMFNMISGYSTIQAMQKLCMAPRQLKPQLLAMIEREIQHSSKEKPGFIMAKMNSLSHIEIINALYKASCAHVTILLNIRGICMLIPGVKGLSENISVVSIIDRYLEHSRVFYFQNGGKEELYLSSSDWMPRNLDRRVELMFPVLDKNIFGQIKNILESYFKDNQNAFYLGSDGIWNKKDDKSSLPYRAQEVFHTQYEEEVTLLEYKTKDEFKVRRRG